MTTSHSLDAWRAFGAACALVASVGFWAEPISSWAAGGTIPWLGAGESSGFNARIDSEPPGADIFIDGTLRGTAPFLGSVSCKPDQAVEIKLSKKGFRPWVRNPLCRHGATLEITARLKSSR